MMGTVTHDPRLLASLIVMSLTLDNSHHRNNKNSQHQNDENSHLPIIMSLILDSSHHRNNENSQDQNDENSHLPRTDSEKMRIFIITLIREILVRA